MSHKTITISEEAYDALARMKKTNESFTDVILRLTSRKGSAQALLDFIERMPASEEFARNVQEVMKGTRRAKLREVNFSR